MYRMDASGLEGIDQDEYLCIHNGSKIIIKYDSLQNPVLEKT